MNGADLAGYRKQIEAALEYADHSHTFDDVCDSVAAGRLQFWPGPHSVIITEVLTSPQHRTLNFFLAGGVQRELEAMTPLVLEWGRKQGCKNAVLLGRRGWERTFLTRTGWRNTGMIMLQTEL